MTELHYPGTAKDTSSMQTALIRGMMDDFAKTIRILQGDISTEEKRVNVFDKSDPRYPILARALTARLENLEATIAALGRRLEATEAVPMHVVVRAAA